MKIRIPKWFCRLGNNIIQVMNMLILAIHLNCNLYIPKHKFFKIRFIQINDKKEEDEIEDEVMKFKGFKIVNICKKFNVPIEIFDKEEYIIRAQSILKSIFKIENNVIENDNNDDLYIHIRSGDIFKKKKPSHLYKPPPLSYYQEIIDNNNYQNIYLIAKDDINPVINKLLEIYPQIKWDKNPLEKDINIILNAKNIVVSIGTFVPSLLLISNNTKVIFSPSEEFLHMNKKYITTFINKEKVLNSLDYSEYFNKFKKWKNNEYQRNLLLTFQN